MFHYSAIVFLIAYPVYWIKLSRRNRPISLAILVLVFIGRKPLFNILKLVLNKGHYGVESTGAYALFIIYSLIYVVCVILSKNNEQHNGLLNIFFLACLTQAFGSVNMLAARTTFFFAPAIVLLVPQVLSDYRTLSTKRVVYGATISGFFLVAVMFTARVSMFSGVSSYFFWE